MHQDEEEEGEKRWQTEEPIASYIRISTTAADANAVLLHKNSIVQNADNNPKTAAHTNTPKAPRTSQTDHEWNATCISTYKRDTSTNYILSCISATFYLNKNRLPSVPLPSSLVISHIPAPQSTASTNRLCAHQKRFANTKTKFHVEKRKKKIECDGGADTQRDASADWGGKEENTKQYSSIY